MKKTENIPEQQVTIPAHTEYPDVTFNMGSKTIKKNDTVSITVVVRNSGGAEKWSATEDIEFDAFPSVKEVVGVARLSFVEVEELV